MYVCNTRLGWAHGYVVYIKKTSKMNCFAKNDLVDDEKCNVSDKKTPTDNTYPCQIANKKKLSLH
jgi:hypothetical protein